MKTFYRKVLSVVVLGALPMLSTPAAAGMDSPCLDGNMDTCIIETALFSNDFRFGNRVGYSITNNLEDTRLFAFGVTNTVEYGTSNSEHPGWYGQYISKDAWNNGEYTFEFYQPERHLFDGPQNRASNDELVEKQVDWDGPIPTMVWVSGGNPVVNLERNLPNTYMPYTNLGTFETLFGTEDDHVSFFWNVFLDENQLTAGVTLPYNFLNEAQPQSDFSTFGALGNVVTTSVTAVPEPETYAMFLAGLGLLGFARRNKQA